MLKSRSVANNEETREKRIFKFIQETIKCMAADKIKKNLKLINLRLNEEKTYT